MSKQELRRVEVLGRVKRGELKRVEAADLLELSYRQAKRLKQRYEEGGPQALVHGSVGRAANRYLDEQYLAAPAAMSGCAECRPPTKSRRAK